MGRWLLHDLVLVLLVLCIVCVLRLLLMCIALMACSWHLLLHVLHVVLMLVHVLLLLLRRRRRLLLGLAAHGHAWYVLFLRWLLVGLLTRLRRMGRVLVLMLMGMC
jgi:hypothetical protein